MNVEHKPFSEVDKIFGELASQSCKNHIYKSHIIVDRLRSTLC